VSPAGRRAHAQESKATVAKIIYDRSAGEVRVIGRHKGQPFQKTFPVEHTLAATLKLVSVYLDGLAGSK
jgi:hypothetical protein